MIHPARAIAAGVKEWLNEPTPRKQMLPAYVILTIGIILGFARFEQIAEQRADDVAVVAESALERNEAENRLALQTICLTRVQTRDSLRDVLLSIVELFPEGEGAQEVHRLIETDYPPLDPVVECDIPVPGTD